MGWDVVHERLAQDLPRTLEEIGNRWGVSRERVRQIEVKTKEFLARYLHAHVRNGPRLPGQVVAARVPHLRARRRREGTALQVRTNVPARRKRART